MLDDLGQPAVDLDAAWSLPPRFVDVLGSRMHYVEDGAGTPVVFMHGNPTWSYIWRNVIPWLAPHHRCLAFDHIGMGRSAKPDIAYTFLDHAEYVAGFMDALALDDVVLVLQDWGCAQGLHWAREHPERVSRIALIADTAIQGVLEPVDDMASLEPIAQETFRRYRDPVVGLHIVGEHNHFIESTLHHGALRTLSDAEMAHYRGPFIDLDSRRMIQRWNQQVPIGGEPAENVEVIRAVGEHWTHAPVPKLLLHTDWAAGPGTWVQHCIDTVTGLTTRSVGPAAGHYVQEDVPDGIGRALLDWLGRPAAAGR